MFRKPQERKVGAKVLVEGETGVGKSRFALSFPKSVAFDSEAGIAMYEGRPEGKNLELVANTQDFNQLQVGMKEVEKMIKKDANAIETMIIDSETKFYQNLTDTALTVEEKKARKAGRDVNDSNISVRGWGRIKNVATRLQNMKIDMSAKGINVVSVSQISDVKKKVGDNFEVVGYKADMAKNADYDYDIIIHLYTEDQADGTVVYKGKILKDRTGATRKGQVVENPSYEIWKERLESGKALQTIETDLVSDSANAMETLEATIEEEEKAVIERFKELMTNEKAKAVAVEMIGKLKIKNPLSPTNEAEHKQVAKIVEAMEKALA